MQTIPLNVDPATAQAALIEYKKHRNVYDARDWKIERIYRQIAKGKTVISVGDSIRAAGLDEKNRPRLAIMRADQTWCSCETWDSDKVVFSNVHRSRAQEWHFEVAWTGRPPYKYDGSGRLQAVLPRIPPQHRPPADQLSKYHILWEAEWTGIPRDPYLLKRLDKDAWLVCAAWDLTDVEMAVLKGSAGGAI